MSILWKPKDPSSWRSSLAWVICDPAPLPRSCAAAANRPATAPNATTRDMTRNSASLAAGRQDRDGNLSQSHRPAQSPAGGHRVSPLPEAQPGPGGPQRKDLSTPPGRAATGRLDGAGKKNSAAIHQEVTREVNRFLGLVFAQRHKDGRTDLEAVES